VVGSSAVFHGSAATGCQSDGALRPEPGCWRSCLALEMRLVLLQCLVWGGRWVEPGSGLVFGNDLPGFGPLLWALGWAALPLMAR